MLAAALAVLAFAHGDAIYTMSADGAGVRRATTGGDPAFSPSGDMLAFTRRRGDRRSDLWVSGADGTNARRLVRSDPGYSSGVGSPAWSPDGGTIAFTSVTVSAAGRIAKVELVGRDGRNRRTVIVIKSPGFESMTDPTWTPDGRLLYVRARELPHDRYAFDLRSVAADGSGDTLFLRNAASAAFSPDGTRIAFSSMHSGDAPIGDLGVANADGSGRHIIFKSESDEGTPSWSPDGARIAFASGRNVPDQEFTGTEIYTVAPDGSCLTWLTNGDVDSALPAWAPGGTSAVGCATDRAPLQELRAPARGTWWLGRSFGTAMLSSADSSGVDYDDCSAFDPRACPGPFEFFVNDMCRERPALRDYLEAVGKFRRVRGGALAGTLNRVDGVSLVVLAGRTAITVYFDTKIAPKPRRALFDRIIARLRQVGSPHRAKLPPPRVDASLRKVLSTRVAVC
jgi:Tol biopolymer transport system component